MYSPLPWLCCAMQYANARIFEWDQFFARANMSWRRLICAVGFHRERVNRRPCCQWPTPFSLLFRGQRNHHLNQQHSRSSGSSQAQSSTKYEVSRRAGQGWALLWWRTLSARKRSSQNSSSTLRCACGISSQGTKARCMLDQG